MNRQQKVNRMRRNRPQRTRRRNPGTQHIRASAPEEKRASFFRRLLNPEKARAALQEQASRKRAHHITPNRSKGTMLPSIKTRGAK